MNRIRGGAAIAVGVALLLAAGGIARAQETTGRVTGRVTDKDTNAPLGGVTVVLQGPQGEDATLTDDKGEYHFTSLPVGPYVLRFYAANATAQVEQRDVIIGGRQDGARERQDLERVPGSGAGEIRHHRQAAGRRHRQRARRRRVQPGLHDQHPPQPHLRRHPRRAPRARSSIPAATSRSAARPASRTSTSSTASTSPASNTATSRRERRRSAAAPTCPWSSCSRSTSARAAIRPRWAAAWAA